MHFVGLFLSSLLKMHGPKNKIDTVLIQLFNTKVKMKGSFTKFAALFGDLNNTFMQCNIYNIFCLQ